MKYPPRSGSLWSLYDEFRGRKNERGINVISKDVSRNNEKIIILAIRVRVVNDWRQQSDYQRE